MGPTYVTPQPSERSVDEEIEALMMVDVDVVLPRNEARTIHGSGPDETMAISRWEKRSLLFPFPPTVEYY